MKSLVRTIFAVLMVITSMTSTSQVLTAHGASGTSTRYSELTGVTVDIGDSGSATFVDDLYYSTTYLNGMQEESFWIEYGNSEVAVSFFTSDMELDKLALDYVKGSQFAGHRHFAIVGAMNDVDRAWYVTEEALYFNQNFYGYHEFSRAPDDSYFALITIYSGEDSLTKDIAWMQRNVHIDGAPVLTDADAQEIEMVVNGTSALEPIAVPEFSSVLEDWTDQGLVSETEWHGDLIGNEYTWADGSLRFPFEAQDAIMYLEPNRSSTLNLTTKDRTANILVTELINDSRPEISDWTAWWSSEEMLIQTGNIYPAIAITETDTANSLIFQKIPKYDLELYTIRQGILMPDGGVVMITIVVDAEHAIEVYSDITSDLRINGDRVPAIWSDEELMEIFPASSTAIDTSIPTNESPSPATDSDSSTSAPDDQATAVASGNNVTAEQTGVVIDLGPSGDAVFVDDGPAIGEGDGYTVETFTAYYGTTFIVIDVMDGDVNVDDYMLTAESDIAATSDYMDWLGGTWSGTHSWDVYSGAYKLDYRETVYLDLYQDPDTGIYFGIGVYGSADQLPADISWLQNNVTIDGDGILSLADVETIGAVVDGSSEFTPEAVPMPESTVSDWADAGLISETEWQSPFSNTMFTWDGTDLVFPFAQADAIEADDGVTVLELRTGDRRGEIKLTTAEVDYVPADWVENLTSEDYLGSQEAIGQPITILDTRITNETGSVVFLFTTDLGDPVVTIIDVFVTDDGVTIMTEISASPEDIAAVYSLFWDSVQANGDYYPLTWSIEEIQALEVE